MRGKCAAITGKGQPCKGLVKPGNSHCPAHDPGCREARSRAASKAGKSKPGKEIKALKQKLEKLASDVLEGHVEKGDAAVVTQVWNAVARLIELERRIREEEELTLRIEALEQKSQRGENRWRA